MRKALRIFAVAPLLRAASGFSKSPENVPIAYTYSPLGGLIEIDPETEPILEDSLEYFSHGHAALHFPAQSICLPGCWVTKSFCKYDTVDMCDPSTCSVLAKTSPDVC
eukprot:Polyplicarium_translucidae@DN1587_c0_g1_i1.p1